MPHYECSVHEGALTDAIRAELAEEITRLHVAATGAPRSFVHVRFFDISPGHLFVGGKPATRSFVNGTIRAGRSLEVREQLMTDLSKMWTRVTGQSEEELSVSLHEVDAGTGMRGGLIMPQPGQEAEWFERNRERLTSRSQL